MRGRSGSPGRRHRSTIRATPKHFGIETIYQTLALADNIDAPGNLFLGREKMTAYGTLDDTAMEAETRKGDAAPQPQLQRTSSSR